jgi:fructokinase
MPDRAWDYLAWPPLAATLAETPGALIYRGSLIGRSASSRETAARLERVSGLPVFLDVNLRPPHVDAAEVRRLMSRARWLKLNADEVCELSPSDGPLDDAARHLLSDAGADWLATTLGADGAFLLDAAGMAYRSASPAIPDFFDAVGAGDAFSAVMILAILRDWPPAVGLRRAVQFAAEICRIRGAVGDDPGLYERFFELPTGRSDD